MPGTGLFWATWASTPGPRAFRPGRQMLRGSLSLCPETGGKWCGVGRDLKQGQSNCLEASFPGGRKAGGTSRRNQAPGEV